MDPDNHERINFFCGKNIGNYADNTFNNSPVETQTDCYHVCQASLSAGREQYLIGNCQQELHIYNVLAIIFKASSE